MPKVASKDYNLAFCNPKAASMWSPKNSFSAYSVTPFARKKAWWCCSECSFEWEAQISKVGKGSGCPKCARNKVAKGNSFGEKFPDKIEYWSEDNTLAPYKVSFKSSKKVIWQCKNQHKWEAVVASVASGTGCPVCSGLKVVSETSFKAKFPERAQYWHKSKNDEISPESIAAGSDKKFWFTCASGHDFEISPNS
tara:strand:+ start:124 stop:708 length:585 start_codon:yes stop_codon:yes gene_type:complete